SLDECAEALRDGLVLDGFGDVDAELVSYLRDPPGFNRAAEVRVIDAALAQAERARVRGETAKALAAANRVLSWQPDHAGALALAAGLRARWRRWASATVALALALVASAVAVVRLRVQPLPPPPRMAARTLVPAPVASELPPRSMAPPATVEWA